MTLTEIRSGKEMFFSGNLNVDQDRRMKIDDITCCSQSFRERRLYMYMIEFLKNRLLRKIFFRCFSTFVFR
jgi:hypothetical protein